MRRITKTNLRRQPGLSVKPSIRLGEITLTFKDCGHGHKNSARWRDRVRLFKVDEEKSFVPYQNRTTLTEPRKRQRSAEVTTRNVVPVKPSRECALVVEKAVGIECLVPQKVVGGATIILCATL